MNIGLYRREHLESGNVNLIGDAVVDQFQRTHGALTAWQEVEHTDDGHHTDIHATSITVAPGGVTAAGPITSGGGFSGAGGNVEVGELPNAGTPLQSGGYGIKLGPWRIISDPNNSPSTPTYPGLIFQMLNEGLGNFLFRFIRLGVYDWALAPQTGLQLALGWGTNRLSNVITAALNCVGLATLGSLQVNGATNATGDINTTANIGCANFYTSGGIYEYGRTVQAGWWQSVPMSGLVFTTLGGGAWTPAAGSYFQYTKIGRTIFIDYNFINCTIPAGASTQLFVTVPAAIQFQSATFLTPVPRPSNAGVLITAYVQIIDASRMVFIRNDFGAWVAGASNTSLGGTMIASST